MPKGKKKAATAPTNASPAAPAPTALVRQIETDSIRPNQRNPRLKFPQHRIEALAESLDTAGMLVPLTVYEESADDGTHFVLLDGERRLRAAKWLNWEYVPAWVTDKPTNEAENTLRMFNIHLLRDDWGDMATALALKLVMEETGIVDENELSHRTGLGRDLIRNMKRVLEFPQEWQDRVLNEDVPFNLLVELDKAVLSKKNDPKKADVLKDFTTKRLRNFFLKGYSNGTVGDVVDLRKVGTLIDTAASPKNPDRVRDRAAAAIDRLMKGDATIEEAYQFGAAASIEIHKVLRDIDDLPGRLQDIASTDLDDEDRARLREGLKRLRQEIGEVLKQL